MTSSSSRDEERYSVLHRVLPTLPIARRLYLIIAFIGVYSAIVASVILYFRPGDEKLDIVGTESTVLNGIVLGMLLGFRNNEAKRRWWDARLYWGQLINEVRNFSMKVRLSLTLNPRESFDVGTTLVAFSYALKRHLRGGGTLQELAGFNDNPQRPAHVPFFLAQRLYSHLSDWHRNGRIDGYQLMVLDPHVKALMDICGACERIRSSPLPMSYRALLRHGLFIYFALTPWYMGAEVGLWCVPACMLVAYFLLGIELTAEEVEEPFGSEADDLALDAYCRTIKASVQEVLGTIAGNPNVTFDGGVPTESSRLHRSTEMTSLPS